MDKLIDEQVTEFGPVIYTYSTKQAIADGFLVDISAKYPELVQQSPVKLPVIFTSSIWRLVEQSVESGNGSYPGIIWDVLFMFAISANANKNVDCLLFEVIINNGKERLVTLQAKINCRDFDDPKPTLFFDVAKRQVS